MTLLQWIQLGFSLTNGLYVVLTVVHALTLFQNIQLAFSLSNGLSVLLTMRGKVLGFWVLLPAHIAVAIYFGITGQYFLIIGNTIMFTAGTYGIYRFKHHGVHRDADVPHTAA